MIRQLVDESRKTRLVIEVTYNFGRRIEGSLPPTEPISHASTSTTPTLISVPTNSASTIAPSVDPGFQNTTQGRKGRKTKTDKFLSELEEHTALMGQLQKTQLALQKLWACKDVKCSYHGKYCWIDAQKVHYPLNAHHLNAWAESIEKTGSFITGMRPPPMVQEVLKAMHRKKSRISEKKEVSTTTGTPISSQNFPAYPIGNPYSSPYTAMHNTSPSGNPYYPYGVPPTALPFPYTHPTSFPGSMGLPPISPYMPYNTHLPQSEIVKDATTTTSPDLKVDTSNTMKLPILPSSPVESGNLADYITCHISRDASNKEQYLFALHILQSKYYDLQTIQEWKGIDNEAQWERLGIEPGIGIRLARDLSSWAKGNKHEISQIFTIRLFLHLNATFPNKPRVQQNNITAHHVHYRKIRTYDSLRVVVKFLKNWLKGQTFLLKMR